MIEYQPFVTVFETSGEIIVENDLRDYFNEEEFDVNGTEGIIQTMEHYSKQGMLHGFDGNSCPTLYLSEKNGDISLIFQELFTESNYKYYKEQAKLFPKNF